MNSELELAYRRAAKDALLAQDACNLSGVVHSFSRVLSEVLWPMARERNLGTEWVNQHPISRAYADKIAELSRSSYGRNAIEALNECERIADAHSVVAE